MANYFYLAHLTVINPHTRTMIYLVCCVLTVCAAITGAVCYKPITQDFLDGSVSDLLCSKSIDTRSLSRVEDGTVLERLKDGLHRYKVTLFRKEVGYILLLLIFNGNTLSFYSFTFETCIGNTFPERSFIPLTSLVFGATEVIASIIFQRITTKVSNRTVVLFLYMLALTSWFLAFLVFPDKATYEDVTEERSFVTPTKGVVMVIAVLLALADTGYNIVANTSLGILFQADSEIGFMLLNGVMSLSTATVFFASSFLSLYTLLAAEVVLCTAATIVIVMDLSGIESRERE